MNLFAEVTQEGINWVELLSRNGVWVFLIVMVIGGVTTTIVSQLLNHRVREMEHRERLAMINAGIHPDCPPSQVESEPLHS